MQNLAAYMFEATVKDTNERLKKIDLLIENWLSKNKGVEDCQANSGTFVSLSGDGTGAFERKKFKSKLGFSSEIELIETAHTGAAFTTLIQVACMGESVSVFVSLSATPGSSLVAPIKIYPRCPTVVRDIIENFNDWQIAGQTLPFGEVFDATNSEGVRALCSAIRSESRRLPIVVVSMDHDEQVWNDLHIRAAEQLIGLADVAFVDAESSWLLTDELGAKNSCYLGAVRIYWPLLRSDDTYEGITWIAQRLAAFGIDDHGRNRFLSIMRRTIMSAAASTLLQPGVFRLIQNASMREGLETPKGQARDTQLDSIIEENTKLSEEIEKLKKTISNLEWKLNFAVAAQNDAPAANDDGKDNQTDEARQSPEPGETRFYKKIGSGGGVDVVVQTKACQHKSGNWTAAFKGDQAEKGIAKLEGRSNWQSLAHCSACTGGGRWRVHW